MCIVCVCEVRGGGEGLCALCVFVRCGGRGAVCVCVCM